MIEYAAEHRRRPLGVVRVLGLGHRRPDAVGRRPSGRGEPRQGPRARGDRPRVGDPQLRASGAAARPRAGAAEGADDRGRHGHGRRRAWRSAATRGGAATRPAPRDARPTAIATLPTPVQRMDRLAAALGTSATLLVKRDDLTGLALGGNKARKLALLVDDARRDGRRLPRDRRRTAEQPRRGSPRRRRGASGSTATSRSPATSPGAARGTCCSTSSSVRRSTSTAPTTTTRSRRRSTTLADRLRAEGRRPYAIPVGGASTIGVAAYALAVDELRAQLDADPDWMRRRRRFRGHARGSDRRVRSRRRACTRARRRRRHPTRPRHDGPDARARRGGAPRAPGARSARCVVDHDARRRRATACCPRSASRRCGSSRAPRGSCSTRCTRGRRWPR